jgi:UMF1 family MFS transporter
MIITGIIVYIIIVSYAYFLKTTWQFWVLAMLVASSQGGIQALSRSYFGKIIPPENSGEFFGFYNIFGKFAAIIGPILVGSISQLTGSSRYGVLSIVILFIAGLVLMILLRRIEGKNSITAI